MDAPCQVQSLLEETVSVYPTLQPIPKCPLDLLLASAVLKSLGEGSEHHHCPPQLSIATSSPSVAQNSQELATLMLLVASFLLTNDVLSRSASP